MRTGEVLLEVVRNEMVESIHNGHLLILDSSGNDLLKLGDVDELIYPRSAVKSLQAGEIDGSWDYDPVSSGISLADLAISALKGENPAKTIQTKAIFYDKTTVANFVSWDDRIAAIKK